MKVSKVLKTLLGLHKEEVLVMEALSDITMRTSDIQKMVDIPRTTLERILKSLHERGLIHKHKYSARRGGWKSGNLDEIIELVRSDDVTPDKEAYKTKHVVGLSDMRRFEYDFMERYRNKKYCGIQGVRAWRAFHATFGEKEAHHINSLLVKNSILADIIISEKADKELLKRAYFDRPSLAHSIPDMFLKTAFDIEITNKEVVLMNWETKRAISIKDEELAKLFLGIFEYIKESSKYYNVYKEIESS